MRCFIAILPLIVLSVCADDADFSEKPILSFSVAGTNSSLTRNIGRGLDLRVEHDSLGWEVGVYRNRGDDNLLYPQSNWHGAYACQLSAWSHRAKTFPDERIIPIRGTDQNVRVRLVGALVSGNIGNERFTKGRADIYLESPTPHHDIGIGKAAVSDEQEFLAILQYYRNAFPSVKFGDGFGHQVDGPTGHLRLHIAVPVAIDKEYQHPFSAAFLESRAKSTDGLVRSIARDLLLLQHKRLFSYKSRNGYNEIMVDSVTYVVDAGK